MDWLFSIIRVAGASFPVSASLVQLQAVIDAKNLSERVAKLEDPINFLQDDVPEFSRFIYQKLKAEKYANLDLDEKFSRKYGRAIAALESQGFIKGVYSLGNSYAHGVHLKDPSYIMYLCSLEEKRERMESLIKIVDECNVGEYLDGKKLQLSIDLPLPVINAVFEIYQSKGYGHCSNTIGVCQYMGKV